MDKRLTRLPCAEGVTKSSFGAVPANHMKIKAKTTVSGIKFDLAEKDRWGLRGRKIRMRMGIINKQRQEQQNRCCRVCGAAG